MRDFEQVKADAAAKRTPEQQAEYDEAIRIIQKLLVEEYGIPEDWIS